MSQESCPVYLGDQLLDSGHKVPLGNSQDYKEAIFIKAGESSFNVLS